VIFLSSWIVNGKQASKQAKHKNKKKMKNRLWIIEKQQICGAYQARTTEKNV